MSKCVYALMCVWVYALLVKRFSLFVFYMVCYFYM